METRIVLPAENIKVGYRIVIPYLDLIVEIDEVTVGAWSVSFVGTINPDGKPESRLRWEWGSTHIDRYQQVVRDKT